MNKIIIYVVALVWLTSGLVCKILNFVPRHQEIVARILDNGHSRLLTVLIGTGEVIMAVWVVSKFKTKLNAITQIVVILAMNILEFILAPDLLLWGRMNIVFAFLFVGLIYYNEFYLTVKVIVKN